MNLKSVKMMIFGFHLNKHTLLLFLLGTSSSLLWIPYMLLIKLWRTNRTVNCHQSDIQCVTSRLVAWWDERQNMASVWDFSLLNSLACIVFLLFCWLLLTLCRNLLLLSWTTIHLTKYGQMENPFLCSWMIHILRKKEYKHSDIPCHLS